MRDDVERNGRAKTKAGQTYLALWAVCIETICFFLVFHDTDSTTWISLLVDKQKGACVKEFDLGKA
jgi:hypothetical protein